MIKFRLGNWELTFADRGVIQVSNAGRLKPAIIQPPGRWMRTVSEFLFSRKTFEGVFEPLIADQAHEWAEAIAHGQHWKARWIPVRYAVLFVVHVLSQGPLSVLKIVTDILKVI